MEQLLIFTRVFSNSWMPRYKTIALRELELQVKSEWSDLLTLLIPLHVTPFCGGYVKKKVFVPPLPLGIDELKFIITAAIETVNRNMLERQWDELKYRLDIC